MLREFAAFLETEHEFVVLDDEGKPFICGQDYNRTYGYCVRLITECQ